MKITLNGYKFIHESQTCFGKISGQPLKQFNTLADAQEAANSITINETYPYQCSKCGYYHLAPKSSKINVVRNACSCRDSQNRPKCLYLTKEDAEKQLIKSQNENHVKLRIYECSEHKGFHLTHIM